MSTQYDKANAKVFASYDYHAFMNDSLCMSMIDPKYLGAYYSSKDFKFGFDVRSFITAFAVNKDLMPISHLEEAIYSLTPVEVHNGAATYMLKFFVDNRYPGNGTKAM